MATKVCNNEYTAMQEIYDEALVYISQGLLHDNHDQHILAHDLYKKGLEKINIALNVKYDEQLRKGFNSRKIKSLRFKMQQKKSDIERRIHETCFPNAEGISSLKKRQPLCLTYSAECGDSPNESSSKVHDLFHISDGVQLFFISARDIVTTSSSLHSLHIYESRNGIHGIEKTTWLQVGSWKFSLVPGKSAVLESSHGAFIFPDMSSEQASVGVILPRKVSLQTVERFENLLESLTNFPQPPCRRNVLQQTNVHHYSSNSKGRISKSLSDGLVTGAQNLSYGLVKGAAVTSEYIHKGTNRWIQNLQPEKSVVVTNDVRLGLEIAKDVTSAALAVTGFFFSGVCNLAVAVGTKLSPYVREQSIKVVRDVCEVSDQQATNTVDNAVEVAKGAVQGLATVYVGLENAAKILAGSLADNSVNVVEHVYGSEAGGVVDNALTSIGNLALTSRVVRTSVCKTIAETAKDTGASHPKDFLRHQGKSRGASTSARHF